MHVWVQGLSQKSLYLILVYARSLKVLLINSIINREGGRKDGRKGWRE